MVLVFADRGERWWHQAAAWLLGFMEGRGDLGLTWDDPYTPRSVAYDHGRNVRRLGRT
jgi:hypothetical protein